MDEMAFDWDDLRLFLAVARHGGLATAATTTGKSAPTLGRRMLALERRLGRELFRRPPQGYALTAQGNELLEHASAIEQRIVPLADSGAGGTVPVIKVSAGTWVTYLMCNNLGRLVGTDPVRLRFTAEEQLEDIGRREALIGIRNHRPQGTGLAGRRTAHIRFAIYATDPDIEAWALVLGTTPSARWSRDKVGRSLVIEVTNPRNALDLALAGKVRVVLPTFIGRRFNTLQQVSGTIDELDHEQWLVTHHEDRFLPEVRKTIDRVYALLKSECADD
jgi:DNA-binding transcriptional LysR family regulator